MKPFRPILFSLLLLALFWSCKHQAALSVKNGILIESGTIITANKEGKIIQFKGTLLIEGDSILYCGEQTPIVSGTFQRIDAKGQYIIPGLIDSHVHIGHPIALKDEHFESHPHLAQLYFEQLPKSYLYYGFTSLIDLDLKLRTKQQFEKASIRPELYSTGRGVRYFNGYGQTLFPKPQAYKIFPKWIYDHSQIKDIPTTINLNQHSVQSTINQTINEGAIGLKTYYETGFGGAFNWPVPSDTLLANLVKVAHHNKLPVVLHATSFQAYQKGLKADIDIFAHGIWHWDAAPLVSTPPDSLVWLYQQLAKRKKYVQSTMRVILGEEDTYNWSMLQHPELKHSLPQPLITWLASDQGKWAQRELIELYNSKNPDSTITHDRYFKAIKQRIQHTIAMAAKNGVQLILGSDTPASEGIGNPPGLNGYLELQAMHQAGIDLESIFLGATFRNAKAFHLQHKLGSLFKGQHANLLILNQSPLESIEAYNSISKVMTLGIFYNRPSLSARNLSK